MSIEWRLARLHFFSSRNARNRNWRCFPPVQVLEAHVLNHLLDSSLNGFVGFVLLLISLKEIVGEGGSRSSWPLHKHESVSLFHNRMWKSGFSKRRCQPDLCHNKQQVFPFYRDLFLLRVKNVFRFPEKRCAPPWRQVNGFPFLSSINSSNSHWEAW